MWRVLRLALLAVGLALPLLAQVGSFPATNAWGEASTGNTSTVALNNGQSFTGTWELNHFPSVFINVRTDQSGTLQLQFSPDGTNADSSIPVAVAANTPEFHQFVKGSRYFRVVFTNDSGSNQTFMRLHTSYGTFGQLTSALNSTIGQDADSLVVRPIPFELQAGLGLVSGYTTKTKFGRNSEIDTTTDPEDVWEGGGLYTGQPVTCPGELVEVLSSDANDTSAGTGARTVTIEGLNDSFVEQTETITLSGVTPVDSASNYCRVFRAFVATAGTGETNAGMITIRSTTTTANVFAAIPAGVAQTQIAAFTVPASKKAIITGFQASITRASGAAGSATGYLLTRPTGGVFRVSRNYELSTGAPINTQYLGFILDAQTDIRFRINSVSDNDTISTAEIYYYLVDE